MSKVTYHAPVLESYGSIESITGTFGCEIDLIKGNDKGIGYPSDTFLKFIPVCDLPNGGDDPNSGV